MFTPQNKPWLALALFVVLTAAFLATGPLPASAQSPATPVPVALSPTAPLITATPLPPGLPTPSAAISQPITTTQTVTGTQTVTVTQTLTATQSLTGTVTVTPSPTAQSRRTKSFMPMMLVQLPPAILRVCSAGPLPIPDNLAAGVNSSIKLDDSRFIQDLDIQLNINHTYAGDLRVTLNQAESGRSITLLDRPIDPSTGKRCKQADIKGILDDEMTASVQDQCSSGPAAIAGMYLPKESLAAFDNQKAGGTWTLNVADLDPYDTGELNNWCLVASVGQPLPPTPPPPAPVLPESAQVAGFSGQNQAMPLDCESRVAVDWARHFGTIIDESEFFYGLPVSDDPDAGFVGNVFGAWGQIPPYPYGVHAEPVATLLRSYGVPAYAHRPLRWDDLRAEIAAGRPVYVWVIGPAAYTEIPVYYTAESGHLTIVAHYEHVVNVVGYDADSVTIQDGSNRYTRSIAQFLRTWSALGNMAITAHP